MTKEFLSPNSERPAQSRFGHHFSLRQSDAELFSSFVVRHLAFAAGQLLFISVEGATLPSEWQNEQQFNIAASGLTAISLPVETLDKARAELEDLRLYDDAGNEVPYLIERPTTTGRVTQPAKSFAVTLNRASTVVTVETGLAQPVDGLTLESPASSFIKSVVVEGSADAKRWQTLAEGQPIFRQANGVSQMRVGMKAAQWKWMRLTIDDQRSEAIPFSGARVHAASVELAPVEATQVTIRNRHENPGETRLTLSLGAANLTMVAFEVETTDPLFTRRITVAAPQVAEDSIREQIVAQDTIYRVAMEGQPVSAKLTCIIESQIRSSEAWLLIRNDDSPPLGITAVRATRRPVYLIFLARQAGDFHLLTGNPRCPPPRYDLASMGATLKKAAVVSLTMGPVAPNSNYHAPEALAGVEEGGVALDISGWRFRKVVKVESAGAQQIELDLDVLAHSQGGFRDLRLLRGGKQLPYILERTSIARSLTPTVTASQDPKEPKLSRWTIQLSHPGLPIMRVGCATRSALFQREVILYENLTDERGDKYRHTLGSASWVQTPGRTAREFSITFNSPPQQDTMFLETDNGDNPPVELEKFQAFYPATRLLYKAQTGEDLYLYYGNPDASSPRYDLGLVAGQLLAADKANAFLGGEETLKKGSWSEGRTPGKGGIVFWGILAVVVVVLLAIISRLLPKSPKT